MGQICPTTYSSCVISFYISTLFQSGNAVNLNHTQKQWLDFGEHTEACMTRPGTCGAEGGAVSYWMNLFQAGRYYRAGVISSRKGGHAGFEVYVLWNELDKLW